MDGNLQIAFALTLFAGMTTGIGSFIVFFQRRPTLKLLSLGLGFSAGVMIYISLVELLPQAGREISILLGERSGGWIATGCFFAGILLSAIIDRLVPDPENPHEFVPLEDVRRAGAGKTEPSASGRAQRPSLARVGVLTAVVIGVHNFPEGMATFVSAMTDVSLGLSIAIAVAVHNIPEGISVAVPVYFATGDRNKALLYSFGSGLAEPLGALAVWLVLMPFMNEVTLGILLSVVAGIMVFISFDELLPCAREYDHGHTEIIGVILGMAVMAVSLLLI